MTAESIIIVVCSVAANVLTVYGIQHQDRKKRDAQMSQILIAVAQIPALITTVEQNSRDIGIWGRRHERLLGRLEGRGIIPPEEEC